jgi:tyrosinase
MNFKGLLLLGFSALAATQDCRERKEIRDMSPSEIRDFIEAVRSLNNQRSSRPGFSRWDEFAAIHDENFNDIHRNHTFFPWHRMYLAKVEDALRRINPTVTIPYWDWTYDAAQPAKSIIFRPDWFGGSSPGRCVPNGPFANWMLNFPNRHCLRRNINLDTFRETFVSAENIAVLLRQSQTFAEFSQTVNLGFHGSVHVAVGGDMADYFSPADPIFFMHHAFIDKLWFDWQNLGNADKYGFDPNTVLRPFNELVANWNKPTSGCIAYKQPVAIRGGNQPTDTGNKNATAGNITTGNITTGNVTAGNMTAGNGASVNGTSVNGTYVNSTLTGSDNLVTTTFVFRPPEFPTGPLVVPKGKWVEIMKIDQKAIIAQTRRIEQSRCQVKQQIARGEVILPLDKSPNYIQPTLPVRPLDLPDNINDIIMRIIKTGSRIAKALRQQQKLPCKK